MLYLALSGLMCAILVECAVRLPFGPAAKGIVETGNKAMRVVRSKAISDHWKEKAMNAYARKTFGATISLTLCLSAVFGVAAIFILTTESASHGFQSFVLGWTGILSTLVLASIYYAARKKVLYG